MRIQSQRTGVRSLAMLILHAGITLCLIFASNSGLVYAVVDESTWQGVDSAQLDVWAKGIYGYDADVGCVPHASSSSANVASFASIQGIASGSVPAAGMKVGAVAYGGQYIGDQQGNVHGWTSTNSNQGSPVLTTVDSTGLSTYDTPLSGKVAWAELANNTALGSLSIGTKLAVHYGNRTIIIEKMDTGATTGMVNGAAKAVGLWWEAARMLNLTSGSDTMDIKVVSADTPTTAWSDQAIAENDTPTATSSSTTTSTSTASQIISPPTSTTTTDAAFTSSNANTRFQAIFSYLVSKGLTTMQAAAAIGNISQESGGNPINAQKGPDIKDPSGLVGKAGGGNAWGLIQWDPGSRAIEYAKMAGIDLTKSPIYLSTTQLDVLLWHMKNVAPTGASNMLKGFTQPDIESATLYFEQKIEGAGIPAMDERYKAAKIALTYTATGVSTANNCGNSSTAVLGSQGLTALIQQYAWPDNTHSITPTEAYKTAIANARSAGKYVGGVKYPGIDCGGFITRLMQDSGYDATYGGSGNTTAQLNYVASHPDKYQAFVPTSTADLRFGDIAIKGGAGAVGHTFMYIGSGAVPGFSGNLVEASLDTHAPRNTNNLAYYLKTGGYSWFHLTGAVTSGTGAL